MKIRLHKIRKALTFAWDDEDRVKLEDKKIISLILRGFTDEQIINLGHELWMYWDHPTYWQEKKRGKEYDLFI